MRVSHEKCVANVFLMCSRVYLRSLPLSFRHAVFSIFVSNVLLVIATLLIMCNEY